MGDGKQKSGAVINRDPKSEQRAKGGPGAQEQEWPGRESEMHPQADHGEESYKGSGKLNGLTALITGGDSGIGRAIAIAFAREGADVAISYFNEDDDARAYLPREHLCLLLDGAGGAQTHEAWQCHHQHWLSDSDGGQRVAHRLFRDQGCNSHIHQVTGAIDW